MQRPDAQIIDQRHIGGFHVLEHLVRASGKADHRIRAEQGAARFDGDIGLANMHAINLYSLLTSSIHRIQAIIDEQRHSVLRTGLPYDLGCLGRAGDELASRALLRADLHAGEPCRDGLGHHIGNGSAQGVFRTQDQICGNIQIISHAHAIPPFSASPSATSLSRIASTLRTFCSIMFSNPGRTSAFRITSVRMPF